MPEPEPSVYDIDRYDPKVDPEKLKAVLDLMGMRQALVEELGDTPLGAPGSTTDPNFVDNIYREEPSPDDKKSGPA